MIKQLVLILFCYFCTSTVYANIELPEIIGSNMVLQQNTTVNIWGKAKPGKKVTLETSWSKKRFTTQADIYGHWLIQIPTPKASFKQQQMTISDGEPITLENILIGEVWFASGQSNMEIPLFGWYYHPIFGANEAIATSGKYKGVRFATIEHTSDSIPRNRVKGKWEECNQQNAPRFSATSFFFATTLSEILEVPVGVIISCWGGSTIEAWMDKASLQNDPEIDFSPQAIQKASPNQAPELLYNGMVKPFIQYALKGFIWYQGEANVLNHRVYTQRMVNMVKLWRKDWNAGDLPFYYVEIAPCTDYEVENSVAYLREAQFKAQAFIPNCGMVCTNDLVDEWQAGIIHPGNKKEVGKRLVWLALQQTYGFTNVVSHGPEYKSMEVKEGKIYLSFDYADRGFNRHTHIQGFEIAGEDKFFLPPDSIEINWKTEQVILSHKKIPNPVAARYCFKNFQIGNFGNALGFPMVPFRTDQF